jgi:hypothetical protein
VASLFAFYDRTFRLRFGKYRLQTDYKPIRTLLGVICEAGEPFEIDNLVRILGYNTLHQLYEIMELLEPFIETSCRHVAVFHHTFAEWLYDLGNPFGIDVENVRELLAKASESGLAQIAYAWQPEQFGAKASDVNSAALYGLDKGVFDHLAAADRLLDRDGDESLIAIGLIVRMNVGGARTWPQAVVPSFLSPYLEKIIANNSFPALLQLVAGISLAVKAFYLDGGVYLESPPGSGKWFFTSDADKGHFVAIAFHLSAAAAGVLGNDSKFNVQIRELLLRNKAQTFKVLEKFRCMAYIAGGFSFSGWGNSISGYFEDAGLSVYSDLNGSIELLSSLSCE